MPAPRLLMVIHSLDAGGAERVFAILAAAWAARGWHVMVATYSDDAPFHRLPAAVVHRRLGLARPSRHVAGALANVRWRIAALRQLIRDERPDAVVSFQENTNIEVLLATVGLPTPVVVSPRCDPRSREYLSRTRQWLRPFTHRRAARIVMQTAWARDVMPGSLRGLCTVIPNPVVSLTELIARGAGEASGVRLERPAIVGLGRLVPEKGFDLLLEAFAATRRRRPEWRLALVGDGPHRQTLESQCRSLGIERYVAFVGQTANVAALLQQADLFALPSRTEGFPNALCEAMTCGAPVVAADCPMGPREIVRHEIDGLLVPPGSAAALAAALDRLQSDATLRARLSAGAKEISQRFSLARVLQQWDAVLASAAPRAFDGGALGRRAA